MREAGRLKERHTERHIERCKTERQTKIETDRETERETQTDRGTSRETDGSIRRPCSFGHYSSRRTLGEWRSCASATAPRTRKGAALVIIRACHPQNETSKVRRGRGGDSCPA